MSTSRDEQERERRDEVGHVQCAWRTDGTTSVRALGGKVGTVPPHLGASTAQPERADPTPLKVSRPSLGLNTIE